MDYLELSEHWFEWSRQSDKPVGAIHHAIMFLIISTSERSKTQKIVIESEEVKDKLGLRKNYPLLKLLEEIADFGFIKILEKGKNQHTSNIIFVQNLSQIAPNGVKVPPHKMEKRWKSDEKAMEKQKSAPSKSGKAMKKHFSLSDSESADKANLTQFPYILYNNNSNNSIGEAPFKGGLPMDSKNKILDRCQKLNAEYLAERLFIYLANKEIKWEQLDGLIRKFKANHPAPNVPKNQIHVEPTNGLSYIIDTETGKRIWLEGAKDDVAFYRTVFWVEGHCKRIGKEFDVKLRDL